MIQINLLPWRDEQKKLREKQFHVALGVAALLAIATLYTINSYVDNKIAQQTARNTFLTQQTAVIDQDIIEISDLEKKKKSRIDLMNVIQKLQHSRPEMARLFSSLTSEVPRGVYLTLLQRDGTGLTLEGVAKSNARVSAFMRNLDESPLFASPKLHIIDSSRNKLSGASSFTLTVNMISPEYKQGEAAP